MNMLRNSSFEDGWYHPEGVPELQVPEEWVFWYATPDCENPYDPAEHSRFVRPEVRVLPKEQLPPLEQDLFILDRHHTLKIFKGSGAWYGKLQQLTLPGHYLFTVNIFADLVKEYLDGMKVWADDPQGHDGLVRLSSAGQQGPWVSLTPGQWNDISWEFRCTEFEILQVEIMCPFPLANSGIFADAWSLTQIEESSEEYPFVAYGSKIGIHTIASNKVVQFAAEGDLYGAPFVVVKAVDQFGTLKTVQAESPDTILMARVCSDLEGCQGVEDPNTDLSAMAQALMQKITEALDGDPDLRLVDYWEPVNEPDPPGAFGYEQLAKLMIRCMEIAEASNLRLALFSLNAGTPEWDEMEAMVETGVFSRAAQGGHILALHEGVFNDDPVDKWYGDLIPGAPHVEGAGALCFRYRYLYHLLAQRGEVIPLVVSEFRVNGANFPIDAEETAARMAWYDEQFRKDYYALAVLPFTLGPIGHWGDHDYEYAYPDLMTYRIGIKDMPNSRPTDEEDVYGLPREQYERVYVLLSPSADTSWAEAAVRGSWDCYRYTVGGSADDAGIGALESKTVIAVNPSDWGDSLEDFFSTYYPRVRYEPIIASSPQALEQILKGEIRHLELGLHDYVGGRWMLSQRMPGCCLVHTTVQTNPAIGLDFRDLGEDITVICRLAWGYADGTGTLPRPEHKDAFVNAVVQTIANTRGVDYWHVGNEPNNPQEWPGFGTSNLFALTPEYVIDIYNAIYRQIVASIGPPPIDPYYGPGSNNRYWWAEILNGIEGAHALFLHTKTQTNNSDEVWSYEKFSDDPLKWQYLHLRTIETGLEVVPERFTRLPVYITELNPQHKTQIGGELGWIPNNAEWVRQAIEYLKQDSRITGACFYRYELAGDQTNFGLLDKPVILEAIKEG